MAEMMKPLNPPGTVPGQDEAQRCFSIALSRVRGEWAEWGLTEDRMITELQNALAQEERHLASRRANAASYG